MTEATAGIGLMALALFAFSLAVETDKAWWWLLGGTACGFALLVALPNAWWLAGLLLYFAVSPGRRARLREPLLWGTIVFTSFFLLPIIWWWRGPQVADVARTHLLNAWPLSHSFTLNQGFHFIGLEIFYLSPLFFVALVLVLLQLRRRLWDDSRYSLLVCLSLPGLAWQNFSAFFHEGRFELIPALCLPLVLLAGCFLARLSRINQQARRLFWAMLALAGLQSLAGLNPFYVTGRPEGPGYQIKRTVSGENVTGFYSVKRQISWRNLADAVQSMQRDLGATLIITDTPETASALSFYLPHNQFVYVESKPDVITHFDFWPSYDQTASPNDSALFIGRSTGPSSPADPPSADIIADFASVTAIDDPPLPDSNKSWDFWNCQKFIGSGQHPSDIQTNPIPEHDSLPK
jgi:hypothetical protein